MSKNYNRNQKENIGTSKSYWIYENQLQGANKSFLTDDNIHLVKRMADTVAHNIRNPLISIKDLVQLLSEGINNPKYYAMIYSEINKVESIINEFTQIESLKSVNFRMNDIKLLLEETVIKMKELALQKGVTIITCLENSHKSIFGDENQLKQVFENVIKNAIEASTYSKNIYITCHENESKVHIKIQDQGIGIPKEKMKHLFEPAYNAKGNSTGFGLMYSHKIVHEHNGTIQIKSELEVGTTVDIYFPVLNS